MQKIIIKIGGTFLDDEQALGVLLKDIAAMTKKSAAKRTARMGPRIAPKIGPKIVLVHGGGKALSAYSAQHGAQARFTKDGLRITGTQEMLYADRILRGELNTRIVRQCAAEGLAAVGLSCADGLLCAGSPLDGLMHTAAAASCNAHLLDTLASAGYLAVVCSVSVSAATRGSTRGMALNINADEAAQKIAQAWKADKLVSVSDIAGIMLHGSVQPRMNATEIREAIQQGGISGGMVPKARNALAALRRGVGSVVIGTIKKRGDLARLMSATIGTSISL